MAAPPLGHYAPLSFVVIGKCQRFEVGGQSLRTRVIVERDARLEDGQAGRELIGTELGASSFRPRENRPRLVGQARSKIPGGGTGLDDEVAEQIGRTGRDLGNRSRKAALKIEVVGRRTRGTEVCRRSRRDAARLDAR